jgi:hypothetical protein
MPVKLYDALGYYDWGVCVVPASHRNKKVQVPWKQFQRERPSEGQVREWFGDDKRRAIAALMGPVSGGLVCRDFDEPASYERWSANHPKLAKKLPTAATGRPGFHVYALADLDEIRQQRPDGGGKIELGDGELRLQSGCYCLVPPSEHPTGPPYQWLIPPTHGFPVVSLAETGWLPCNRENGEPIEYAGGPRDHRTLNVESASASHPKTNQCPLVSMDSMLQEQIEMAIARTLPTRGGVRHRLLFELARELKAIPALADAPLSALKPIVRQWHAAAVPQINTKPFEETWIDFVEGWDRVKFPSGQEPLSMIFAQAIEAEMPEVASDYEQEPVKQLIKFCRELQRRSGIEPFYLDCRSAGRLLKVDHTRVWRWLRLLRFEDILVEVSKGSHDKHRASRFRYLGPL